MKEVNDMSNIKTPLWIIAICAASLVLFIIGSIAFSLIFPEGEDIREKHLQQHHDEQIKYDKMIDSLEEIKENTKKV